MKSARTRGFTLIEILLSIAIMAGLAAMAFNGLGGFSSGQGVAVAQREFLNALRSTQNKVANGADGVNYKVVYIKNPQLYCVDPPWDQTTGKWLCNEQIGVNLKPGVSIDDASVGLYICFVNPNYSTYAASDHCGPCGSSGSYFACQADAGGQSGVAIGDSGQVTVRVSLTSSSGTKSVAIEGNGMTINRVYAE